MVISFVNEEIKELCNSGLMLDERYSLKDSSIIKRRLLQLSAANDLGEFSPEGCAPVKCQSLNGDHSKFKVPVNSKLHLVFSSSKHNESQVEKNWADITTIQIDDITELENDIS